MNSLLLTLAIIGGSPGELTRPQDGTLIFLENSKKIVKEITDSCVTHVAIVMNAGGTPWVYEAEPPRVRRLPLMAFYREIARRNRDDDEAIRIWLMPPNAPFSKQQRREMKWFLDSQLGRRYSIKNYVRDVDGDGTHCAQLTASALKRSGRLSFDNCQRLSPAALISNTGPVYTVATEALITLTNDEDERNWCQRSYAWWSEAWTWCKWSSEESWKWCWN